MLASAHGQGHVAWLLGSRELACVAWLALACAMKSQNTEDDPTLLANAESRSLLPCAEAPSVPQLQSFSEARVPGTYWIDMVRDAAEWVPEVPPAMPHHHATHLSLSNLADVPALGSPETKRARLTLELTSRDLYKVPDRNEWRATYHARIVSVCVAAGSPSKAHEHGSPT